MSQLSTFFPTVTATSLGLGTSANVTFGSVTTGAVTASGPLSGAGFTNRFAAPGPIGNTTPSTGAFTTLSANNGTQTSTAFAPALTLAQTWNTSGHVFSAFTIDITQTAAGANSTFLRCVASGNSALEVRTNGNIVVPANGSFNCTGTHISSGQVSVASAGTFAFTSGISGFSGQDTFIRRDAASTIAFRDLANPQTFRLYNTTDAGLTNFERGFMRWSSNVLQIGTEAAGTGSNRNVEFVVAGSTRVTLSATTSAVLAGIWRVPNNGSYEFGGPAVRIVGTSSTPQNITFQTGATDRLVLNDTLLGFGGTSSSFPALKRSSTALQVRLADDSAFAPFECAGLTLNGNLTASTRNIVTDTTTGTRIGTGTTQLLGFWNATPAAQPAAVADATDAASTQARLNDLLARLRTIGIIAT